MTVHAYRFGDCHIDLSARELHRAGALASLSPKVFDCLAYLIEHRDRAVGRDELIAAVWGRAEVSDTLLGQTVLKARRAVGDDGNEQRAIRTVPRFGYRWIAPLEADRPAPAATPVTNDKRAQVEALPAVPADTAGAASAAAGTPGPARGHRAWRIAGVLALALAAAIGWGVHWLTRPAPPVAADASRDASAMLAVLPVEVGTAPPEWAWLRLGLMDLIATRLRSAGLGVVPSDNVVALAHDSPAADTGAAVAAATGAHLLVVPLVSRSADRWNVRLLLRAGGSARHEVQAQADDAIVAARRATDRLLAWLDREPPGSDAPDLPLDELLSRADAALFTDDLATARTLLEQAPAALRERPELRLRLAQIAFRAGHFEEATQRLQALLAAVDAETDPVLRGRILNAIGATAVRRGEIAAAGQAFGEAVSLLDTRRQPAALGQAWMGLAVSHAAQGDYDAAQGDFSRARIALELAGDALALARVRANEGIVLARRGHFGEALQAHEEAARSFARFGALNEQVDTLANAAAAELALLQPARALATVERALPLLQRLENRSAHHGLLVEQVSALAQVGRLGQAQALLQRLSAEAATDRDPAVFNARLQLEQARLDFDRGNPAAAARLGAAATAALDDADHRSERSQAWLLLVQALRADGQEHAAAEQTRQFSAWAATQAQPPMQDYAALARAEQAWAQHDPGAARQAWEDALAHAARHDIPAVTARIVLSWGNRLLATGELELAGSVVGRAARWAGQDFRCALLQLRYYHALGEADAWRGALQRAQALAGERPIPAALLQAPTPVRKVVGSP